MAQDSRADYFKERRGKFKSFTAEVERGKMERLEAALQKKGQTKTGWLNEKINEELGE